MYIVHISINTILSWSHYNKYLLYSRHFRVIVIMLITRKTIT